MCCDCGYFSESGIDQVSLIEYLYDNGAVQSEVFSFALRDSNNDDNDSFIDFGWIDDSAMVDSTELTYISVADD